MMRTKQVLSKKKFIILLLISIISPFNIAHSQKSAIQIISSSSNKLQIKLSLPKTNIKNTILKDGNAYDIVVPSGNCMNEPGKPDLPVYSIYILIPNGTNPVISTKKGKTVTIRNLDLAPAQEPVQNIKDKYQFCLDDKTYSENKNYPGVFSEYDEIKKWRGQQYALLVVYPYQYNPVTKILYFYPDLEVNINFIGNIKPIPSNFRTKNTYKFLRSIAINADDILHAENKMNSKQKNWNGGTGYQYMIITHEDYKNSANKLSDWKNSIGIPTIVITTDTIGVDYDESDSLIAWDIDNYIDSLINVWDSCPDYLLLLGDVNYIPTFNLDNNIWPPPSKLGTDAYYADLDDTIDDSSIPDLFYGRIPEENVKVMENIINNIIRYERSPNDMNFFDSVSFLAAFEVHPDSVTTDTVEYSRFIHTTEEIRDFLIDSNDYYVERIYNTNCQHPSGPKKYGYRFIDVDTPAPYEDIPSELMKPTFQWNDNWIDIKNAFNKGRFIINYCGHGAHNTWANPYFNTALHRGYLNNKYKRPIIFSFACQTGYFDNNSSKCWGEYFLRMNAGGGVAFIGATRSVGVSPMQRLAWGCYDAIWPGFIKTIDTANTFSDPEKEPIIRLGEILTYGKSYVYSYYGGQGGGSIYKSMSSFHLLGDPSMNIFPERCFDTLIIENDTIDLDENLKFTAEDIILINNIYIDGNTTTGSNTSIKAGKKVIINSDFKIKKGSKMIIDIKQCSGGKYKSLTLPQNNNRNNKKVDNSKQDTINISNNSIDHYIYPNPANEYLNIEINKKHLPSNIVINSITGKEIKHVITNNINNQLSLKNLQNGIYLITIFNKFNNYTEKIIKE